MSGDLHHMIHSPLPAGSVLELSPDRIEIGEVEADKPTYCLDFHVDGLHVRVQIAATAFRDLIAGAAAKLDAKGNGGPPAAVSSVHVARTLPKSSRRP